MIINNTDIAVNADVKACAHKMYKMDKIQNTVLHKTIMRQTFRRSIYKTFIQRKRILDFSFVVP
jgi:hypothetical protein